MEDFSFIMRNFGIAISILICFSWITLSVAGFAWLRAAISKQQMALNLCRLLIAILSCALMGLVSEMVLRSWSLASVESAVVTTFAVSNIAKWGAMALVFFAVVFTIGWMSKSMIGSPGHTRTVVIGKVFFPGRNERE